MEFTTEQYHKKLNELFSWVKSKYPYYTRTQAKRFAENILCKKYNPTIVKSKEQIEYEQQRKEFKKQYKAFYEANKQNVVYNEDAIIGEHYKVFCQSTGRVIYAVCTRFITIQHFDNTALQMDDRIFDTESALFNGFYIENGKIENVYNRNYPKLVHITEQEYINAQNLVC